MEQRPTKKFKETLIKVVGSMKKRISKDIVLLVAVLTAISASPKTVHWIRSLLESKSHSYFECVVWGLCDRYQNLFLLPVWPLMTGDVLSRSSLPAWSTIAWCSILVFLYLVFRKRTLIILGAGLLACGILMFATSFILRPEPAFYTCFFCSEYHLNSMARNLDKCRDFYSASICLSLGCFLVGPKVIETGIKRCRKRSDLEETEPISDHLEFKESANKDGDQDLVP